MRFCLFMMLVGVALRRSPANYSCHLQNAGALTNGPVANTASPARATLWTAPAERSGDGALHRSPTAVATPTSCVPRPQNPKVAWRFASLSSHRTPQTEHTRAAPHRAFFLSTDWRIKRASLTGPKNERRQRPLAQPEA